MKTVFSLFFVCLWLAAAQLPLRTQNEPEIRVTFILMSPDLPDTSTVFITGGIPQLGMWDPGKVRMESRGDHTWGKEIVLKRPMSIEYKYTLGSWQHEGAQATGAPLSNFVIHVSSSTTIKDTILFWTKGNQQRVNQGQITGTVRYHRSMKGENIAARDVIVWLPPNYESAANERYPVIYMHDGQNIFDPATSSFGVDWAIDETVDALIKKKSIPPVIVVGIYNTPDRLHEYTPGEKGTAYMDFVVRKLKPLIDSTYRTKPGREQTIVGGSSAGGNISFMLLWKHPDIFSKAICMSPAFRAPDFLPVSWDLVKFVQSSNGNPRNVFIYLDNGGVGLERELQPGIDEMLTVLKARGYKASSDFVFILDANAKHSEADWAQRFPKALLLVLGNPPTKENR